MKKALESAARNKKHKKYAQTRVEAMTEAEILALTNEMGDKNDSSLAQAEANGSSESGSESGSGSSSESGNSSSGSGSSESGSDSEIGNEAAQTSSTARDGQGIATGTGLDEDKILALAQVESPNAAVKLTPQVHVQVTRVGHNTN